MALLARARRRHPRSICRLRPRFSTPAMPAQSAAATFRRSAAFTSGYGDYVPGCGQAASHALSTSKFWADCGEIRNRILLAFGLTVIAPDKKAVER